MNESENFISFCFSFDAFDEKDFQEELRTLIRNYFLAEYKQLDECLSNANRKYNVLMVNISSTPMATSMHLRNEFWLCVCIIKNSTKSCVLVVQPDVVEADKIILNKRDRLVSIIAHKLGRNFEIFFNCHRPDNKNDPVCKDISFALSCLNRIVRSEHVNKENMGEKFTGVDFYQGAGFIEMDNLCVDAAFKIGIRLKIELEKVIFFLNRILNEDLTYALSSENCVKLSALLNKRNFEPTGNDLLDLKREILRILRMCRNRGFSAGLDSAVCQKNLEKYFIDKQDSYLTEVHKYKQMLRINHNDKSAAKCLSHAVQDRLEFLILMSCLSPQLLSIAHVNDFNKIFVSSRRIDELQKKNSELEQGFTNLDQAKSVNMELINAKRMHNLLKESNLNELIMELSKKSDILNTVFVFDETTMDKILYMSESADDEQFAVAVIKFVNVAREQAKTGDYEHKIRSSFDFLLKKVSQSLARLVLHICADWFWLHSPEMIAYFQRVLVENEDSLIRETALGLLERLDDTKLDVYSKILVDVERKPSKEEIFNQCEQLAQNGCKLSVTCFERLQLHMVHLRTLYIIDKLIQLELQTIPVWFVQKFLEHTRRLNSTGMFFKLIDNTKAFLSGGQTYAARENHLLIALAKSLLIGKHLTLAELEESLVLKLIERKEFTRELLLLVKTAAEYEDHLSTRIKDLLDKLSKKNDENSFLARTILSRVDKHGTSGYIDSCQRLNQLEKEVIYNESETALDEIICLMETSTERLAVDFKSLFATLVDVYVDDRKVEKLVRIVIEKKLNQFVPDVLEFLVKQVYSDRAGVLDNFYLDQFVTLLSSSHESTRLESLYNFISDSLVYSDDLLTKKNSSRLIERFPNFCALVERRLVELKVTCPLGDLLAEYLGKTRCDLLKHVNMHVENNVILAYDKIDLLIEKLDEKSIECLLKIYQRQNFRAHSCENLMHMVPLKWDTLKRSQNTWTLLIRLLLNDVPIRVELLERLAQNKDGELNNKNALFIFLYSVILHEFQPNENLISKVSDSLANKQLDVDTRIVCAQVLKYGVSRQTTSAALINTIKTRLKSTLTEEWLNVKLTMVSSEALSRMACDQDITSTFLSIYLGHFNVYLNSLCKNKVFINRLDAHMSDPNVSNVNKFTLLKCLTRSLFTGQFEQDFKLVNHDAKNWILELASLQIVSQLSAPMKKLDEFDIQEFQANLNELNLKLVTSKSLFKIEDIVQELLNKQMALNLNLRLVNNILFILINEENIDMSILFTSNRSVLAKLSRVCFSQILCRLDVNYTQDELNELTSCLISYPVELARRFLTGCQFQTSCGEIINFVRLVETIFDSHEQVLEFFRQGFRESTTSLLDWYGFLGSVMVDNDLDDELMSKIKDKHAKERLVRELRKCRLSLRFTRKLVSILKENVNKLTSLVSCLELINDYELKDCDTTPDGQTIIDIFDHCDHNEWLARLNELIHMQFFDRTYAKSVEELLDEINQLNKGQNAAILRNNGLSESFNRVMSAYKSRFFDMKFLEVRERAIQIRENKKLRDKTNMYDRLALIKRGAEIFFKFEIRPVQLMSVLMLLECECGKGRLAQINTGEGKTVTIAMLAVYKALEGNYVDVVTSSTELALRQSKQLVNFYYQFGLTVANNCKTQNDDIKSRYRSNVVYGCASDFQADILRHEYAKKLIRAERRFDVVIVDEVDNMLIDGKNHMVMLSSQTPGMNHLEGLLAAIWIQVEHTASCLREVDGKVFYLDKSNLMNQNGQINENADINAIELQVSVESFIKQSTDVHLRKLLRDYSNLPKGTHVAPEYPQIKIPKHLRQVVLNVQINNWIDSAIYAKYRCELGKNYLLSDAKIVPVDVNNTGVLQENMHWSNGLHQFLQMKHGAKIHAESFPTNFISNVTFFRRYGPNLFGLTGTLGSHNAQNLLVKTYNVDCLVIPPFRKKQYKELRAEICTDKDEWFERIVESCLSKLHNNRAVLIITKYISETEKLRDLFSSDKYKYPEKKIKVYRTSDDSHVIEEKIKSGELIIATNIAGRGTDIITSDQVERNGGLHVCVTFLPTNERVEQQNKGRTSRTGNKGTGQFILVVSDPKHRNLNINELKAIRDQEEEIVLKRTLKEIEKITISDMIFKEFCGVLELVKSKLDMKQPIERMTNQFLLRAIEERFGIWLKQQNLDAPNLSDQLNAFESFKKNILNDLETNQLVQNPAYYVQIGNLYVEKKLFSLAYEYYTKAIELDEDLEINGRLNRCFALLQVERCSRKSLKTVIDELKVAKTIIQDTLMPTLHLLQCVSRGEVLSEQIKNKMVLYEIQLMSIEEIIGKGEGAVDERVKKLEEAKMAKPDEKENIDKQIENLELNKEKIEKGNLKIAEEKNVDVNVFLVGVADTLPDEEDIDLFTDEIEEYELNGFLGCFFIAEIPPIDWKTVGILAAIGLVQIICGSLIAVYSLGAGSIIGIGLLSEGVSDIITAISDGIINRNFSWETYGIHKAISIATMIICAGYSSTTDAAKTFMAGVKSTFTFSKPILSREAFRVILTAVGTEVAKGAAGYLINQLVDHTVTKQLIPDIQKQIKEKLSRQLRIQLDNNEKVVFLLSIDREKRNNNNQADIVSFGLTIISASEKKGSAWFEISKGIATAVANSKSRGISRLIQATEVVLALSKIDSCLTEFLNELNVRVNSLYEMTKKYAIDGDDVNTKRTRIDDENIIYANTYETLVNEMDFAENDDVDINLAHRQEIQATFIKTKKTAQNLSDTLAARIAVYLASIVRSKIINPITSKASNFVLKNLTSGLDEKLIKVLSNYQAQRRLVFFGNKDPDNRIPKEFKKGLQEADAVKKARELIDDVKNNGQLGIYHLQFVSDVVKAPINVYDENDRFVCTIGEVHEGEPIELRHFNASNDNPSGHWVPRGEDPSSWTLDKQQGGQSDNNCLLDSIAERTGVNARDLRSKISENMENHFEHLANQASDIDQLERFKSKALYMGGAKHQKKERPHVEEPKIIQIGDPVIEQGNIDQAQLPNEFKREFGQVLVNKAMDDLCGGSDFLDVGSTPLQTSTIYESKNLRFDAQKPSQEYDNYQVQIGGSEYFHRREQGKSTSVATILIEKPPQNSNDIYRYSKRKIKRALNQSLGSGKSVFIRRPNPSSTNNKK